MRTGRWTWTRVLVLLVALAGMGPTASLGRWQLSRAAQKEAITQARSAQAALPELDGRTLAQTGLGVSVPEALLYRRLALKGEWLGEHTVYLDNRQMHGRPGFYVLTPLRLQGTDTVVMVQRGWVPRQFQDRTALPAIAAGFWTKMSDWRCLAPTPRPIRSRSPKSGTCSMVCWPGAPMPPA